MEAGTDIDLQAWGHNFASMEIGDLLYSPSVDTDRRLVRLFLFVEWVVYSVDTAQDQQQSHWLSSASPPKVPSGSPIHAGPFGLHPMSEATDAQIALEIPFMSSDADALHKLAKGVMMQQASNPMSVVFSTCAVRQCSDDLQLAQALSQ